MISPLRTQFESDDAYYWALSEYYESDEGQAALLEAFKRGIENGTAKFGAEAAAEGRRVLLSSIGLPETSAIGTEELIERVLAESQPAPSSRAQD